MVLAEKEDLRFVGEALLAMVTEERNPRFCSEKELERRTQAARMREREWFARQGCLDNVAEGDELMEGECRTTVDLAKLTERQRRIFELRMAGYSFDEISDRYGTSKQAAQQSFIAALGRIARAVRDNPYQGIAEVYRMETRRRI